MALVIGGLSRLTQSECDMLAVFFLSGTEGTEYGKLGLCLTRIGNGPGSVAELYTRPSQPHVDLVAIREF